MASRQYIALDGLRGVAAISVMIFHRKEWFGDGILTHAYLAVDYFFLLSGFVIAHAYWERMQAGLSHARFLALRAIRLYPLIIVGAAIGTTALYLKAVFTGAPAPEWTAAVAAALAIPHFGGADLWPVNPPTWSLFFELLFSIAFATVLIRLRAAALLAATLGFAIALIVAAVIYGGLEAGNDSATFWAGFARAGFPFLLGVAMQRLLPRAAALSNPLLLIGLCVLLITSFSMVTTTRTMSMTYDLVCVLLAYPIILFAAAHIAPEGATGRVCRVLGDLSYPLYIIHFPLLWLFSAGSKMAFGVEAIGPLLGGVIFVVVIACSWVALVAFDAPVRRWLSTLIAPRRRDTEPFAIVEKS